MIIREFKTEPVLINLAKRYKDWHTPGRPDSRKTRIGEPGSGREFLEFQRQTLPNAVHQSKRTSPHRHLRHERPGGQRDRSR